MHNQPPAISARRRSERVAIAFPIEVTGIDVSGQRFSDRTKTSTVSRYGCAVRVSHPLKTDQRIYLRRIGTNESAVGRIVASLGKNAEGEIYAVGTTESCEPLWGIQFSSQFYEKVLEQLNEGIYFVDRDRRITYWNDGAERLSGYSSAEAVGRFCSENFLGHVDACGRPLCLKGCPLSSVLADGQSRTAEFFMRHQEGHRVPVSVRVMPMKNAEGVIVGAVEIFNDGTAENKVDRRVAELEHLAFRDELTNLPNRRYLQLKLEQAFEEHKRFDRAYGLLMFDLDNFKQVNDTHGHEIGDALLKTVARTLSAGRNEDLVGRWGGEEFMMLMPDIEPTALGDFAERCRVMIAQSFLMSGGDRVSVTASIGATVLSHGDSSESAVRRVDELMYQSKRSGGNRTMAG
jgi:diguanylate cyclase (GGDEF)-like protein/PAS domain S-box-containing protein